MVLHGEEVDIAGSLGVPQPYGAGSAEVDEVVEEVWSGSSSDDVCSCGEDS
mgnify:CR=1 FL=1